MTIAIGCTGGQHRSVAMSEALASRLWSHGLGLRLGPRVGSENPMIASVFPYRESNFNMWENSTKMSKTFGITEQRSQ